MKPHYDRQCISVLTAPHTYTAQILLKRVASSCGARSDQGSLGHLAWHAAFVAVGTRRRGRGSGP